MVLWNHMKMVHGGNWFSRDKMIEWGIEAVSKEELSHNFNCMAELLKFPENDRHRYSLLI